jgi:ubiquinone/menaquinone biosynthesis C-methylase UbiE
VFEGHELIDGFVKIMEKLRMNTSNFFEGELLDRVTDSDYLARRMEMNKNFQLYDFEQWTIKQIKPKEGDRALEVGCGRGTQSIPISGVLGMSGEITLVDLSKESLDHVLIHIKEKTKTVGIHGSMDNLAVLLGPQSKKYDLAYSVYALYYANNPTEVLNEMYHKLNSGGRLCIVGPDGPHGLVEIARKFHIIPHQVDSSFEFRYKVLEPFFKKNFSNFNISFLKNPQSIKDANQLIEFYRQTTYYVKESEHQLFKFAEGEIAKKGALMFDKYSYAINSERE